MGVSGQRHAPAVLYPRERQGTHCTGGWVGPRAGLDGRKISPHWDSIPVPSGRVAHSIYRLRYRAHIKTKVKGEIHPRPAHEGTEREKICRYTFLFNLGAMWGVWLTPRSGRFRTRNKLVTTVQEAGWVPGPVWTVAENLAPIRFRFSDHPSRSESLYLLSYPVLRYKKETRRRSGIFLAKKSQYPKQHFSRYRLRWDSNLVTPVIKTIRDRLQRKFHDW